MKILLFKHSVPTQNSNMLYILSLFDRRIGKLKFDLFKNINFKYCFYLCQVSKIWFHNINKIYIYVFMYEYILCTHKYTYLLSSLIFIRLVLPQLPIFDDTLASLVTQENITKSKNFKKSYCLDRKHLNHSYPPLQKYVYVQDVV